MFPRQSFSQACCLALPCLAIRAVHQTRAGGGRPTVYRSTGRDRFLVLLVILGQMGLPLLYVLSPWLNFVNHVAPPALISLGALTWGIGLWVFWRAHADLGANGSVSLELRSAQQLVTHGVYRRIRHPMYAGFLLLGVAQALLLPNWLAAAAALVAVILMCVVRIPNEEAMMQEHFGQLYREYMHRTGAVLPRLGNGA